jgi:hypothetical protein
LQDDCTFSHGAPPGRRITGPSCSILSSCLPLAGVRPVQEVKRASVRFQRALTHLKPPFFLGGRLSFAWRLGMTRPMPNVSGAVTSSWHRSPIGGSRHSVMATVAERSPTPVRAATFPRGSHDAPHPILRYGYARSRSRISRMAARPPAGGRRARTGGRAPARAARSRCAWRRGAAACDPPGSRAGGC